MSNEIIELALGSTAYGVPNVLRSKRLFNRIFWIVYILAATVTTCYYIHDCILGYLSYDVVTFIRKEYQQPAEFPVVTFCSIFKNGLKTKDLKDLIASNSRFGYDFSIGTNPDNHFELFESQERGICFRFNSGKNMSNHSISIKHSLIGGRDDCLQLVFKKNYDLTIWIHERKSPPKIESWNNHDSPINLNGGSKVFIEVEKTKNSMLAEPFNHCFRNGSSFEGNRTIIDYILKIDQIYRQRNCLELCFDLIYLQENSCNCTNTSLGNVWKDCFIVKENSRRERCTFKKRTQFYSNSLIEKCSEYCPLECDSVSHSVDTVSTLQGENVLYIYYGSLYYTSISQLPKIQPFDLVSEIGGILGLFIGVSFVSLFEIIEIFTELVFVFFNRRFFSKVTDLNNLNQIGAYIQSKQDSNKNSDSIQDLKIKINQTNQLISDLNKEINEIKGEIISKNKHIQSDLDQNASHKGQNILD